MSFESGKVEGWLLAITRALPHGPAEPIGGRGTKPGAMTPAELGGLLSGLGEQATAVALWWLGFDYFRRAAYYAILAEACTQWQRHPHEYARIETEDELRELAALVLEEIVARPAHRTRAVRCRWMGVTPGVWGRRFERPHRRLYARIDEWLSAAESRIRRNLGAC